MLHIATSYYYRLRHKYVELPTYSYLCTHTRCFLVSAVLPSASFGFVCRLGQTHYPSDFGWCAPRAIVQILLCNVHVDFPCFHVCGWYAINIKYNFAWASKMMILSGKCALNKKKIPQRAKRKDDEMFSERILCACYNNNQTNNNRLIMLAGSKKWSLTLGE